jgi:hypothetical protein
MDQCELENSVEKKNSRRYTNVQGRPQSCPGTFMFAPLLYKVDAMDGHLSKRDAVQRVAGQWDERDGRRDET